jgi:3-oxoacyl-[acyl-carrier protein] reductase
MLDLGISGRRALVCGSSAGLGRACAFALARAGVAVVLNGRAESRVMQARADLEAQTGLAAPYVVGDVTTVEGRQKVLAGAGEIDILVNNAAGPPAVDYRAIEESSWYEGVRMSMVAPIMLMQALLPGMIERKWGRIINITSSAVKAPLPLLHLSNGARSGLTGFVAGLAREVAVHGVTVNNLLPGRFETDRLRSYIRKLAENASIGVEECADRLVGSNPMRRFGRPEELGAFCAFIASEPAAYMTGQNILLDGGEYPGI